MFRQIKIVFAFLFILAAVNTYAAEAEKPTLQLIHTVPLPHVKDGFDLKAADAAGQRLFLAAEDNSTLEVIDLAVGQQIPSQNGETK